MQIAFVMSSMSSVLGALVPQALKEKRSSEAAEAHLHSQMYHVDERCLFRRHSASYLCIPFHFVLKTTLSNIGGLHLKAL